MSSFHNSAEGFSLKNIKINSANDGGTGEKDNSIGEEDNSIDEGDALERFCSGDYVIYPAHGLGKINSIESFKDGNDDITMISISFERDRMVIKVPVYRVSDSGLRPVSSKQSINFALSTLKSKVKAKKTMWARRAQEYETKIHSGDPISIAEVLRELHKNTSQGKPSFSERQIYQAALNRLASELAVVNEIDEETATRQLVEILGRAA